jgi:hypothetical protein
MKKFFLFSVQGEADRYFCGDIFEGELGDVSKQIEYDGNDEPLSYSACASQGYCKQFDTLREAEIFSEAQEEIMEHDNEYARRAMYEEESGMWN